MQKLIEGAISDVISISHAAAHLHVLEQFVRILSIKNLVSTDRLSVAFPKLKLERKSTNSTVDGNLGEIPSYVSSLIDLCRHTAGQHQHPADRDETEREVVTVAGCRGRRECIDCHLFPRSLPVLVSDRFRVGLTARLRFSPIEGEIAFVTDERPVRPTLVRIHHRNIT